MAAVQPRRPGRLSTSVMTSVRWLAALVALAGLLGAGVAASVPARAAAATPVAPASPEAVPPAQESAPAVPPQVEVGRSPSIPEQPTDTLPPVPGGVGPGGAAPGGVGPGAVAPGAGDGRPLTRGAERTPGPGTDARPPDVAITVSDLILTDSYWIRSGGVADLTATVTNTGDLPRRVQVSYSLPAGLRATNATGCATGNGGQVRCAPRRLAAGASLTFVTRIRITAQAWRSMPLAGAVSVTATTPERGASTVVRDFGVLFPAGPPQPDMLLSAGEVDLPAGPGGDGALDVRLGNTGEVDAVGSVEAVLPKGLRVTTMPRGCRDAGATRLRCELGTVPAGRSSSIRLPVAGAGDVTRSAPLAGAVFAVLDPVDSGPREMRSSFRVLLARVSVPAAIPPRLSGTEPAGTDPAGTATPVAVTRPAQRGWSDPMDAVTIVGVVAGVATIALLLATVSLRRRLPTDPGPAQRAGGP